MFQINKLPNIILFIILNDKSELDFRHQRSQLCVNLDHYIHKKKEKSFSLDLELPHAQFSMRYRETAS